MPSEYRLQFVDWTGEKSPARFVGPQPVQSGFDSWELLMANLKTAVEGIVLGTVSKEERVSKIDNVNVVNAATADAQRERKWLVTYQADTSHKLFRLEIPTANLDPDFMLPNSDIADLESTEMAAFKAAFEAFQRSPDNGTETVTLISVRHVGRNL